MEPSGRLIQLTDIVVEHRLISCDLYIKTAKHLASQLIDYAVVYISGSTRFMEEATINDGTIVIDSTKQRVITSDDISYNIETFDNVSVIRVDDTDDGQSTVSVKNILAKQD